MAGSQSSSTAVDLSRLPPPDIVAALDFETILAALRADFAARLPAFDAFVESDPAIKLLEVAAYRELVLRQDVNDAARAVMIAYARGGDLDQLAALFGVARLELVAADPDAGVPATMEADDDLRSRVLLAPDGYSVAGPASSYVFHARSASGDVLDASATSPAPGDVVVAVLSRTGDGTAAPALLAVVDAAVSADTVRPLTDRVTVRSAAIVDYAIRATLYLYAGPDSGLILANARAALDAYLAQTRRLGRDVPRSALVAALHTAGVQRVVLAEPAADVVLDPTQAGHAATIELINGGTAE